MTSETDVRAEIAAQRRELAAVLAALPAQRWDEASLCEGWRVREVVAHIVMPFRYSTRRFVVEMVRARGSFHRLADRAARRDAAQLSPPVLVQTLEQNADHPWKPPGGGFVGALSHEVIHGLDFTVPLGLDHQPPPQRVGLVLGSVKPKQIKYFGVDLDGVELIADDVDWRYGTGRPVQGRAQDLLMAVCGRKLPAGLLRGEDAPRFSRA